MNRIGPPWGEGQFRQNLVLPDHDSTPPHAIKADESPQFFLSITITKSYYKTRQRLV
jgi:hypothetical protein